MGENQARTVEAGRAPAAVGQRFARLVTEVLAPAPLAVALLATVAWHGADTAGGAVWTGLVAVLFGSLLPTAFVLRGVRRGDWDNHHVPVREHRRVPLLAGLGSVLAGLALLSLSGAPRELLALVVSMAAGLVVSLLISSVWKMSIHAAVGAGTVVVLALVLGPAALLATPLAALIAWSRVALRDHTPAQAVVGCIVGALVAGVAFSLAR